MYKKNIKKKIRFLIIVMLIALVYFAITNISNATDVAGTWDISADDGESHVIATLYSDGNIIISGTGEMKNYNSISNIPYYKEKENIKFATIEEGVTSIGTYAFGNCRSLTEIKIADSVTRIGNTAFRNCTNLTQINIPNSVQEIGNYAFSYCTALTNISISNSVKTIGTDVFEECVNLLNIDVSDENEVYSSKNGILYNKEKTYLLKCPEGKKGEIIIPNTVETIEEFSFYRCKNLTNVVIPNSVNKIKYFAFSEAIMNNIEIPSTVEYISDDAFISTIIEIKVVGNNCDNIEIPNILKRAMDENDLLYAENGIVCTNCSINTAENKINISGSGSISIKKGILIGTEILIKKYVTFENNEYLVHNNLKYKENADDEDEEIKWITISSDRKAGPRLFLEFDLDLIIDYNSEKGLISYSTLKNWLNKLEEAFDYFLELNPYPTKETLTIDWTGTAKQMGSAYAGDKIVITKKQHMGSLKKMESSSKIGIIDLFGTVLHEMGHEFAGASGYRGSKVFNQNKIDPWNIGTEQINLVMVRYVMEKIALNTEDKIVSVIVPNDRFLFSNISREEILDKINRLEDQTNEALTDNQKINKYIIATTNDTTIFFESNYADLMWKLGEDNNNDNSNPAYNYENPYDPFYIGSLKNHCKIFDMIGLENTKKVFNKYINDTEYILKKYNTSNEYNRFETMNNVIKEIINSDENMTSQEKQEIIDKIEQNYRELYKRYNVNIYQYDSKIYLTPNETKVLDNIKYYYYNDENSNFEMNCSSKNKLVAEAYINTKGQVEIKANKAGNTKIRVSIGNKYVIVNVEVKSSLGAEDTDETETISSIKLQPTKVVFDKNNSNNQQINLTRYLKEGFNENYIEWKSSDSNIAEVIDGVVIPKSNGICDINVKEVAKNSNNERITVYDIVEVVVNDDQGPVFNVEGIPEIATTNNIRLTIQVSDDITGISDVKINGEEIQLKNGIGTYTVTKNGEYEIVAMDNAGNTTTRVITIDKIIPKIVGMKVTKNPNKMIYLPGEDFDPTGIEITLYYNDDTEEVVSCNQMSYGSFVDDDKKEIAFLDFSQLTEEQTTVGICCVDKDTMEIIETYLEITVRNNITDIEVKEIPSKVTYVKGEEIELAGGKIEAIYENGEKQILEMTPNMISGYDKNTLGEQTITVTYGEKTATFKVTVRNDITGIEVKEVPSKVTYLKGEEIELAGGKIEAIYENGERQILEITPNMISGYDKNTLGEQTITVTYGEKTATFKVTVINKSIENIVIVTQPLKTEYIEGENFETAGMKVIALYNNGETKEIKNYVIENGKNLELGQESVTIKYSEDGIEKNATQLIVVLEKLNPGVEYYEVIEDEEHKYIINIAEGTTIKEIKENIKTNGKIEIYKGSLKITDEETTLGTGMIIKEILNNQEETYIAVVKGDLTGDGKMKMADVLKLARYKAGVDKNLEGAYLMAGDVVSNGKIGVSDILKMARTLAGIED